MKEEQNENKQMSLDEYKKKVEEYLLKKLQFSTKEAKKLITDYEIDFPMFWEDGWEPEVAGCAMIHGY